MASTKATGPTVGLDIGTAYIKAVEMRPGRGKSQVAAIGIMPTPPNTVTADSIIDPVTLGAAVKRLLQESGIGAKKVVASITSQTNFVLRILPVPTMTDKELVDSMKWEVERHVPFRPDEIIQDYVRLPSASGNGDAAEMPVLLVVGQKGLIDAYTSTLLYAGLTPVALDVEPLSLIRTAPLHEVREGCVAIVNIGATKTDVGVFDKGALVYPRSIPVAGNNLTRSVADTLGLPTEQAERLKVEVGEIPENRTPVASIFDDAGGAFGAFDLPDEFGAPAAETTTDFGAPLDDGLAFDTPVAPIVDDEPIHGFAAPLDDEAVAADDGIAAADDGIAAADDGIAAADDGIAAADDGIAFTMEDEDQDRPPAAGGFSFSLEDDEPAPAAPVTPAPPAAGGTAFSFDDDDDDLFAAPAEPAPPAAPSFAFDDDDTPAVTASSNPFGEDDTPAVAASTNPFDEPVGETSDFVLEPTEAVSAPSITEAPVPVTPEERQRRQVGDALAPVFNDLALEIRRTLDVYANRPDGRAVERVYLSGGTARMPGLARALEQDLGIPVQLEDPTRIFPPAGRGLQTGYYADIGPVVALAIGLGARDHVPDPTPPATASAAKGGRKK